MVKTFSMILFYLIFGASFVMAKPTISIDSSVEVSNQSRITLLDIVEVKEGSFLFNQALADVEVPIKEGMTATELNRIVREGLKGFTENLDQSKYRVIISSNVKIKKAEGLSQNHLLRLFKNRLGADCSDCIFSIQFNRIPEIKSSEFQIDFSSLNSKGAFMVPLREPGMLSPKWITGSLQKKRMIPVANRLLNANERIQPGDISLAPVDVTWSKDNSFKLDELIGQQLQRSISAGNPIWTSDIKREPALKRGQVVRALIGDSDQSFEISTQAQAEDAGFIGDIVKVKTIDGQKILSGLVVEKGVVRIQ